VVIAVDRFGDHSKGRLHPVEQDPRKVEDSVILPVDPNIPTPGFDGFTTADDLASEAGIAPVDRWIASRVLEGSPDQIWVKAPFRGADLEDGVEIPAVGELDAVFR
jgi:hypothetical protein